MSKFKVGDRVKIIKAVSGALGASNKIGTITKEPSVSGRCKCNSKIHCIHVRLENSHTVWAVGCVGEAGFELEILNLNKTTMSKLNTMMKTLLDKPTQKLVKADFINGDLQLTEEGKEALNTIIFEANKDELVKLAEEKTKETES